MFFAITGLVEGFATWRKDTMTFEQMSEMLLWQENEKEKMNIEIARDVELAEVSSSRQW